MTTFLGAPVLVRGEAWGNIYLTEKEGGAQFDEADEQALLVLARWVAIAIENAHLYEDLDAHRGELERAVTGLEATVAITRAIGGETDIERVLELVVKRGRALVDARLLLVLLAEGDELVVAAAAGEGGQVIGTRLTTAQTALAEILRTGHAERLTDLSSRVRLGLGELSDGASAAMLVPLNFHGRPLGLLAALDRFDSAVAFTADDERLMRAFAGSAATALATAQNVEEEQLQKSIAAADGERARWARELHDETLQGLGALQVMLTAALRGGSESLSGAVEQAIQHIETQVHELQGLITELRPAALDDLGLAPALDTLYARLRAAHGLAVSAITELAFDEGDDTTRLAPAIEGAVYRLVQEALTNTAKHASTDRAQARIIERDGEISIEISDEGIGFDPAEATPGFGLVGMRERVELAGGRLEVDSRPGGGTRVSATLPARHRDRDREAIPRDVPPAATSA
jgi:signal transduction histidine kinase